MRCGSIPKREREEGREELGGRNRSCPFGRVESLKCCRLRELMAKQGGRQGASATMRDEKRVRASGNRLTLSSRVLERGGEVCYSREHGLVESVL